jgi:hypothetical protein
MSCIVAISSEKEKVVDARIKTSCKEMECMIVDWMHLAQVLVNMVINLQVL